MCYIFITKQKSLNARLAFVFHLHRDFYIVRNRIVTFYIFSQKNLDTFHDFFLFFFCFLKPYFEAWKWTDSVQHPRK